MGRLSLAVIGSLAVSCLLANGPASATDEAARSPYRMDAYRAPVPDHVEGGRTITSEEAHRLWLVGEVRFIDVMPRTPKPDKLAPGTVWRDKPRHNIPGSIWLPNVGYGALHPEVETWYRNQLAQITEGDPDRPLVIYCQDDCWMSWNAVIRAAGYGYRRLYWYPGGADAWSEAGYPLQRSEPTPMMSLPAPP